MTMMQRVASLCALLGVGLSMANAGCEALSPILAEDDESNRYSIRGTPELEGTVIQNTFSAASLDAQGQPVTAGEPDWLGICTPNELPVASEGSVPCSIFSASPSVDACDCDGAGREATRVERAFIEAMFESYSLCGANTEIACSDYCVCTEPPAASSS